MAETMEALVPVPAGTLTDEDYENMIVAAMLPSVKTEVVPTVEIAAAAEPEKPADPIVVVEPAPAASKPKRICGECGHPDRNSVGRIKLGEEIEIERDGMKLRAVKPICNVCFEKKPPSERKKIAKIGGLISVVGLANRKVYAERDARVYWTAWKVGKAEPLQARRDEKGRVLCGVPGCKFCRDDSALVARYVVVKDTEGKRAVGGFCREQFAALIGVGALRSVQLFDYRGVCCEIERRNKKDVVPSTPPPVVAETKSAPASQPVEPAKPKLTRAERERRRDERRARLAAELERDKAEAAKRGVRYVFGDDSNRGKGGQKKNGGKERRH